SRRATSPDRRGGIVRYQAPARTGWRPRSGSLLPVVPAAPDRHPAGSRGFSGTSHSHGSGSPYGRYRPVHGAAAARLRAATISSPENHGGLRSFPTAPPDRPPGTVRPATAPVTAAVSAWRKRSLPPGPSDPPPAGSLRGRRRGPGAARP